MKGRNKGILFLACILSFVFLAVYNPFASIAAEAGKTKAVKADPIDRWQAKPKAAYDASKMGDMSDFDPAQSYLPRGIPSRLPLWPPFPGRPPERDRFFGMSFNGWPMTSINGAAFSSMAKRSLSRSSRPIICPSRTSARRSVNGWSCRRKSMSYGAPTAAI